MLPALFALVILRIRSCVFAWASLDNNLPIYSSYVARMTGHHIQLIVEIRAPLSFCLDCPWTAILLVSASWITEIRGVPTLRFHVIADKVYKDLFVEFDMLVLKYVWKWWWLRTIKIHSARTCLTWIQDCLVSPKQCGVSVRVENRQMVKPETPKIDACMLWSGFEMSP
jgi:hypothetical protein